MPLTSPHPVPLENLLQGGFFIGSDQDNDPLMIFI